MVPLGGEDQRIARRVRVCAQALEEPGRIEVAPLARLRERRRATGRQGCRRVLEVPARPRLGHDEETRTPRARVAEASLDLGDPRQRAPLGGGLRPHALHGAGDGKAGEVRVAPVRLDAVPRTEVR